MTLNEYQEKAMATAIYGEGSAVCYPILGLVGEAGEIANKYKKVLRDNEGMISQETRLNLAKELGDVLWYCAALARDLGFDLNLIATMNVLKLAERHATGTIQGSGDDREKVSVGIKGSGIPNNICSNSTGGPVNYVPTVTTNENLNYKVDVPPINYGN